jgi:hypothetical protein
VLFAKSCSAFFHILRQASAATLRTALTPVPRSSACPSGSLPLTAVVRRHSLVSIVNNTLPNQRPSTNSTEPATVRLRRARRIAVIGCFVAAAGIALCCWTAFKWDPTHESMKSDVVIRLGEFLTVASLGVASAASIRVAILRRRIVRKHWLVENRDVGG